MASGVYSGTRDVIGPGISLVEDVVFGSGWLSATIETQQFDGHAANGWLVVDYEELDNQTYAGALDGQNRWHLQQRRAGTQRDLDDLYEDIATGTPYTVEMIVRGGDILVFVDGEPKLTGRQGGTITCGLRPPTKFRLRRNCQADRRAAESFSEQPQAVKAIQHSTGVDRYEYDGNGNMVLRVEISGTKPITCGLRPPQQFRRSRNCQATRRVAEFDVENRLVAVTVTNGLTQSISRFEYDGDGNLEKKIYPDGSAVVYPGPYIEFEVPSVGSAQVGATYYFHGGRRVAMRKDGALYYLYGDHLGSTSLTTNSSGGEVGRQLYHPYGTVRWSSGELQTDFTFTGQRSDSYLDILAMGVRWYSPRAARWLSADSIVPDPADPQSLNRYSYVLGNPLKYTDPTGLIEEGEYDDAMEIIELLARYGVYVEIDFGWRENPTMHPAPGQSIPPILTWDPGAWELDDLGVVRHVVLTYGAGFGGIGATRRALGGVTLRRVVDGVTGHYEGLRLITLADYTFDQSGLREAWGPHIAVAHEFAHYWDWKTGGDCSAGISGGVLSELGPTAYGRTSPEEDWAESVAGYLYPVYFQILRAEGSRDENFTVFYHFWYPHTLPGLGPYHRAAVASRFADPR